MGMGRRSQTDPADARRSQSLGSHNANSGAAFSHDQHRLNINVNYFDLEKTMNHTANIDTPIHSLLSQRWSPYTFDPTRTVTSDDLQALFEAARWTASAFNAQPWRYIVGVKGRSPQVWEQVLEVLVEGNQGWAQHVPVLALGLVQTNFEHNGKPNQWAIHDLGAASANLTLEASSRGLSVHQMAGIEPDKAISRFSLADNIKPITALAIGYHGHNLELDRDLASRDQKLRERKATREFLIHGQL
jgi:nitroreductase